jgi:hypothetical protein
MMEVFSRSARPGNIRRRTSRVIPGVLATLLLLATAALAHNPDTSCARIAIADDEVTLRLTYDLFTLHKIAAVDADRDGRVTREEMQRAAPEIDAFLRSRVHVGIDGKSSGLGVASLPEWPREAPDEIAAADWHSAAALIEAEEVVFIEEEPDYLFDPGYAATAAETPPRAEPSLWANLRRFIVPGVGHSFLGYDHICFLLALLLVSRFGELVKIVTSFTVAHSMKIAVGLFGPGWFLERAFGLGFMPV